jgi:hypothetical protein
MRILGGAIGLGAAAAAFFVGSSNSRCEDEQPPIRCVTGESLPIEQWHDVLEFSAGAVKYAAWGDLRFEVTTKIGATYVLHAFALSATSKLPERDKDPKAPVWLPDKRALDEKKDWVSLSDPTCPAVQLAQGEIATQQVVVIGVSGNQDKKGSALLWWRFGLPPKEKTPVYETWGVGDAKIIMEDRWHAPDLKPRVVPCVSEKKEDTFLVLHKGKRVVAVLRLKPAVPGGDPYERALISVDADAQRAVGTVNLAAEASTKVLVKFMTDHAAKEFDPRTATFLLSLDGKTFFVIFGKSSDAARTFEIYDKPSD